MKALIFLLCILLTSEVFSQTGNTEPRAKIIGSWLLYKDSSSEGKIFIISDEIDTINFFKDGKFTRKLSTTVPNDATVTEYGLWYYSDSSNAIILTQRSRDYHSAGGKTDTYINAWKDEILDIQRIDLGEFIDKVIGDATKIVYYRYYRRVK